MNILNKFFEFNGINTIDSEKLKERWKSLDNTCVTGLDVYHEAIRYIQKGYLRSVTVITLRGGNKAYKKFNEYDINNININDKDFIEFTGTFKSELFIKDNFVDIVFTQVN